MKDWMPFFSISVSEFTPWPLKYLIAPLIAILQLMVLVFLLALAAKLAWII